MISAERFLDLLEEKDLVSAKLIESLRRQIAEADTPEAKSRITAALVAKRLVDGGHLSRRLAQRLLDQADTKRPAGRESSTASRSPSAASSDPDELRIVEDRQEPEEEEWGFADEELAPLDEELAPLEDDLAPLEDVAPPVEDELVPLDELIPLDEDRGQGLTLAPEPRPQPSAPKPRASQGAAGPSRPAAPARPPETLRPPVKKAGMPASSASAAPLDELVPLSSGAAGRGSPLDDLMSAPSGQRIEPPKSQGLLGMFGGRKGKAKGNVWDSPLLLIGGGTLLLLLILGGVLVWAISRQSAEELLQIADESYNAGSYTKAVQEYDRYLEKAGPEHAGASTARIRRGLAQMRQATTGGSDPSKALEVTKSVLGQISSENAFRTEAQPELAAMLPKIAEDLSKAARQKTDPALVAQTEETLGLIDKYLLKTSMPYTRLADIRATLALTKREIARDAKLAEAIAAMEKSVSEGKTAEAYLVRTALLKEYPDLLGNEKLQAAVLAVSHAEMSAVKRVVEEKSPATADAPLPYLAAVPLARRETTAEVSGVAGRVVCAAADGAAYGLDAATGKVLWRRPVGFPSNGRSPSYPPTPMADAPGSGVLLVDAVAHELVCLDGPTGKLRWRFPLEERFDAHPVIAGKNVLIPTRSGRLVMVDVDSGESAGYIQLPQELRVGPAVTRDGSTAYQMAEHSNLYVLSLPEGACRKVAYLQHEPGSITVPPVIVGELLVVARNDGVASSRLQVLSLKEGEQGPELKPLQELPMKGHVDTAPLVSGRRLLVVTDKADMAVFEVRDAEPDKPLGKVADGVAAGEENLVRFPLLLGEHFFLGDALLTKYDILASRGRLQPRWTENGGSATLQPLVTAGSAVIHIRREVGLPGVFVSAVDTEEGKTLWQTQLGVPLAVEPLVGPGGDRITAITSAGAVYQVAAAQLADRTVVDQPLAAVPFAELRQPAANSVRLEDGSVAIAIGDAPKEVTVATVQESPPRLRRVPLPDPLGGPLAAFAGGLLAPLKTGPVFLFDPRSGNQRVEPFLPTIPSGAEFTWRRPTMLGDQEVLLSDGSTKLYRVGIDDNPKRHMVSRAVGEAPAPIRSAAAVAGSTVYTVDASDRLLGFALPDLKQATQTPLSGPCVWGPWQAGTCVLLATDEQLHCVDPEQPRWKVSLPAGLPAGVPLVDGESFLLASTGGAVCRIEAATGKVLGKVDIGLPLANGPVLLGGRLLVAGHDGTLYEIAKP